MSLIKVGVLGAAGTVGQRFVQLLANHPWFEVTALAGSERTQGQTYADAVQWHLGEDPPAYARTMTLQASEPGIECEIVFSALPGEIAGPMETRFAAAGYKVFTNAGAHRMDIDVPLMVPYLNPDHLAAIPAQQMRHKWSGFILSNPNCASIPLAMALARCVSASVYQAYLFQPCRRSPARAIRACPRMTSSGTSCRTSAVKSRSWRRSPSRSWAHGTA